MARGGRRYARDNRGRFASVGATARGGRLRTAAGNKRATVTVKAKPAKAKGTVSKPKGLKPGTLKPKAGPSVAPAIKATRAPRGAAKPNPTGPKRKVDVQIRRAKPGGEFGPDGHWYAGGAWMSQGKFVGGKTVQGVGAGAASRSSEKGKGRESQSAVIRNKAPAPKVLTPPGTGLPPAKGLGKKASALDSEFFGGNGFLNARMERGFRPGNARPPIDNTRYIAALANRVPSGELRGRTLQAVRRMSPSTRRGYIRDMQDARRDAPFMMMPRGATKANERQIMDAIRFDTAARNLAGQRAGRRRRNARNSNEEYAWVTNAMLSTSRRRQPKPKP
jgi:hypothetical protein